VIVLDMEEHIDELKMHRAQLREQGQHVTPWLEHLKSDQNICPMGPVNYYHLSLYL